MFALKAATVGLLIAFSGLAEASGACKQHNSDNQKQFSCADGTIKKISVDNEQLVIKTYHPESKSWTEDRFPVSSGLSLDSMNLSVFVHSDSK
jgi:hypothetical protein